MKKRIFIIFCLFVTAQWTLHGYKGCVANRVENLFVTDAYAVAKPSADPQVIVNSLRIDKGTIDVEGEVCNEGDRDFVPPEETGAVIKIELKNDPDAQSDPDSVTLKYHEVKTLKSKECITFTGMYDVNDVTRADKSAADEKCKETKDRYLVFSIVPIDPCNVFFPTGQDADSKNNRIVKSVKIAMRCL